MASSDDNSKPTGRPASDRSKADLFATTHWSVVLSTCHSDPGIAFGALELLCKRYWPPVYNFVRRRGLDPHAAEDLTQGFFAYVLEKETFARADRTKGKFRTFLLTALTGYLNNEWDKGKTLKRGGAYKLVSLEELSGAGSQYEFAAEPGAGPEKLFDQTWARTVVESINVRLQREYSTGNKPALFQKLLPLITRETVPGVCQSSAAALEMTEEAFRMALSRVRRRFGELLREEILRTVAAPDEVDGELRHLFASLTEDGTAPAP